MSAPLDLSGIDGIKKFFSQHFPNINLNASDSSNSIGAAGPGNTMANLTRNDVLLKLLVTCGGLAVSFGITFVGVKWMVEAMDPTRREKKEAHQRAIRLMKKIGVQNVELSEYELCIASNLVDPLSMVTSWQDIGGLEECIEEIQESVILPFRKQELFSQSSLLQPPKGVLLYGPPGCGKTMIAKATAKAAGARFINLQVSSLVDKWYGESQKRAEAVFSLALKLQPSIIFIDEIDSFLRSRTSTDHEATAMIKTQFMSFWDGLLTSANTRVIIMGATNRPRDVDAAILRRMPACFHVGLPKKDSRQSILELVLREENLAPDVDLDIVSRQSDGFSGSDLKELCRNAALYRVRDYLHAERQAEEEEEERCAQEARREHGGDGDAAAFVIAPESSTSRELRVICANDFTRALHKMRQNKAITTHHPMLDVLDCD